MDWVQTIISFGTGIIYAILNGGFGDYKAKNKRLEKDIRVLKSKIGRLKDRIRNRKRKAKNREKRKSGFKKN